MLGLWEIASSAFVTILLFILGPSSKTIGKQLNQWLKNITKK